MTLVGLSETVSHICLSTLMCDTSVFTIVNEAFMVFSPTATDTLTGLLCVFVCPVLLFSSMESFQNVSLHDDITTIYCSGAQLMQTLQ